MGSHIITKHPAMSASPVKTKTVEMSPSKKQASIERAQELLSSGKRNLLVSNLHIEASLSGLRHLMYRHSWISAVLGIGTNILVLFTIIGVSWARFRVGHAEITREEADAVLEDEGSGEPELEAVEEGEEQEVREVAALVEQPRTLSQSLGNKFKWFLIRLV